jgi:hypothetical protein
MGTMADRNSGISRFVGDLLEKQGLDLFEKWFEHLKQINPANPKITDFEVRDQMLQEIISLVSEGNSLVLGKKDKLLVEELLNRFLLRSHLLKPEKTQ